MIKLTLLCILGGFLLSLALTPGAKRLAVRFGVMDVPKDSRRMHKRPIPRMGGLAIFVSFLAVAVAGCRFDKSLVMILLGAAIITILGIIDDKYALSPVPKLIVQIIAASLPVIGGLRITFLNPFGVAPHSYWDMGWLSVPLTIIWIVAVTNAINFVDGLDGLAGGVTTIACASLLVTAVLTGGSYNSIILLAALIGGCLGFLPYNFHPASVFMGDTGSTFLGYMLAVISVGGMFKTTIAVSFIIPVIALGLPIVDTAFVIVRRMMKGKSPMSPDKTHLHHRLVEMGFSQVGTVLVIYLLCAVCGAISVGLAVSESTRAWWILLAVFILLIGVFRICLHAKHEKIKSAENETGDKNNGQN